MDHHLPEQARQGPRPLPLHLAVAMTIWLSSRAALPLARSGSLPWRRELQRNARALTRDLGGAEPSALDGALEAEARRRLGAMLDGIEAYRVHPYRRSLACPPVIWSEGASRLYDYGTGCRGRRGPSPVLFVPSLVNRGYILDLSERRSLLRYLAGRGVHPLLLEWGAPGDEERGFDFTDYVAGRLERALDAAVEIAGGPVSLVGYCMGGLMALALALRRPADIDSLALLATPWDFHAEHAAEARRLALLVGPLDHLASLPVDFLQALFAALDPLLVPNKFRAFARLDPDTAAARDFVALEDWVNDGIALTGPVARGCFVGWYGANEPARGAWRIAGRAVRPEELKIPTLAIVPGRDRIVPPKGAMALGEAIPDAATIAVPLGHIGMIASAKAPEAVWRPLAAWLADGQLPGGKGRDGNPSPRNSTPMAA
ncbi:MAG: alpha/beta fold hydrolase [Proteobacteria bacterium]|nr:alpha/beta fold hydrolase [Pseudomonadota bacterium]